MNVFLIIEIVTVTDQRTGEVSTLGHTIENVTHLYGKNPDNYFNHPVSKNIW